MNLRKRFEMDLSLKYYEIKFIIITLLSTLLLINIWPRFRNDVMSVDRYWYVISIAILLIVTRGKIFGEYTIET